MNKNEISVISAPTELCMRRKKEEIHAFRTEFQRDRDRILYSKAFRRLSGKTQVFLPLSHDHVRTRLTHTLEVVQVARVTARNLSLNEDLTEAIALGHDIGHTPFGHVGERTLNFITNGCDSFANFQESMPFEVMGFKHNLQGLRVACELEKFYREFKGMNLSNFTLWGIKNHSKVTWAKKDKSSGQPIPCEYFDQNNCYLKTKIQDCPKPEQSVQFYKKYDMFTKIKESTAEAWSFEGFLVAQADEIAQRHHDIEDALHMGIVSTKEALDIVDLHFRAHFDKVDKQLFKKMSSTANYTGFFVPLVSKFIVNLLNRKLIEYSLIRFSELLNYYGIHSKNDFIANRDNIEIGYASSCVSFEPSFASSHDNFQSFLKNRILNSFDVQRMDGRGTHIIRKLFKAYLSNPGQLPDTAVIDAYNIYFKKDYSILDISQQEIGTLRDHIGKYIKRPNPEFQIACLRAICDHIAGMTDNYALDEYNKLYAL